MGCTSLFSDCNSANKQMHTLATSVIPLHMLYFPGNSQASLPTLFRLVRLLPLRLLLILSCQLLNMKHALHSPAMRRASRHATPWCLLRWTSPHLAPACWTSSPWYLARRPLNHISRLDTKQHFTMNTAGRENMVVHQAYAPLRLPSQCHHNEPLTRP